MTISRNIVRKLTLSTVLAALPLSSVFAQDAAAVADRLKGALANQGIELGWTNVSGDSASMVIEAATIKPAGEKNALPIGNVTLTNVSEANGGYVVEKLSTQPFSKTEDGITLDVSAFVIDGMNIPPEGSTDPLAALMMYESAELANLTVKMADKTAFSMQGLGFEITAPADGKPMEFSGGADSFSGDLTLVDDPQSKAVIEAMGYQQIKGSMALEGSWQPTDGRMALSQYEISVENAGTLGMTFDLGGYTLDFVKALQEMNAKMAAQPEGGDNSAAGMAMLGLMQQLTINSASVRFDDDTLTGKILDFVAKQQNMSPTDIANQAKAIVPFLTTQLNNPELASQITTAVNAYLDKPGSIEVEAAPAAPVPFAQIMAGAMANPMDLTKTLGLKVTANQQ